MKISVFSKCQTIPWNNLVGIVDSTLHWISVSSDKSEAKAEDAIFERKETWRFWGQNLVMKKEMAADEQDRKINWICLKAERVQMENGDWKQRRPKGNEFNQMVKHNNAFVENPVFEFKQFHFPIKSLWHRQRMRNRKRALEKLDKRNPKYAITRLVKLIETVYLKGHV